MYAPLNVLPLKSASFMSAEVKFARLNISIIFLGLVHKRKLKFSIQQLEKLPEVLICVNTFPAAARDCLVRRNITWIQTKCYLENQRVLNL